VVGVPARLRVLDLRIKVPYIPTPKEDERENHWVLSLPNIIVCALSLGAVAYGLHYDWSPFSLVMAAFVLLNVAILSVVIIAGQHKLIGQVREKASQTNLLTHYVRPSKYAFGVFRHRIYNLMRTGAPAMPSWWWCSSALRS
jgi:cellulose synthase (UDP-forming)